MALPEEFEVTVEQRDGTCVVRVRGEVDLATHEQLAEKLHQAAARGGPIVVDMSACEFIDSSGIRALLLGDRDIERFAIASPTNQVKSVLDMTGVSRAVPTHASLDEALQALD